MWRERETTMYKNNIEIHMLWMVANSMTFVGDYRGYHRSRVFQVLFLHNSWRARSKGKKSSP